MSGVAFYLCIWKLPLVAARCQNKIKGGLCRKKNKRYLQVQIRNCVGCCQTRDKQLYTSTYTYTHTHIHFTSSPVTTVPLPQLPPPALFSRAVNTTPMTSAQAAPRAERRALALLTLQTAKTRGRHRGRKIFTSPEQPAERRKIFTSVAGLWRLPHASAHSRTRCASHGKNFRALGGCGPMGKVRGRVTSAWCWFSSRVAGCVLFKG